MHRCLQLAQLGLGYTAPNPIVGSVLVHNDRIIGEGYHKQYGGPHAERNCIDSVTEENKRYISSSTLYVSLEPCVHTGKTAPCTSLIIQNQIPRVVIGCRDPFTKVNGKGIEKLQAAGVIITEGILETACQELNKRFFTFHTKQQPYVILKWAQTANGKFAFNDNNRLYISNEYSNRLVHKWRSEETAILIGTNTAMQDDPLLTNRLWSGSSPVRIVLDRKLRLPGSLKLFHEYKTIVFTDSIDTTINSVHYSKLPEAKTIPQQLLKGIYQLNIQSVLIEGGATLLQSFINEGLWNEARIITNKQMNIDNGTEAPQLHNAILTEEQNMLTDNISFYRQKL